MNIKTISLALALLMCAQAPFATNTPPDAPQEQSANEPKKNFLQRGWDRTKSGLTTFGTGTVDIAKKVGTGTVDIAKKVGKGTADLATKGYEKTKGFANTTLNKIKNKDSKESQNQ